MGVLYDASMEVKSWITDQPVKEESLTDWMLRYISKNKKTIYYYMFDRIQEASNGADWLWCFKFHHYIYLFLVQAKKVKRLPSENFNGLNQHHGDQIKNLLNEAKAQSLFPLYTFYTNMNYNTKCGAPKKDEGVFLASAYDIKALYDSYGGKITKSAINPTSPESLLSYCVGLSCLEECPLIYHLSVEAKNFEAFLSRYLVAEVISLDESTKNEKQNTIYRYKNDEVPAYINALPPMNPNCQNYTLPEWYTKEFKQIVEKYTGIVMFDYSGDQYGLK